MFTTSTSTAAMGDERITYGDVFPANRSRKYSRHNFEYANTEMLFQHFKDAEAECRSSS